MHGHTNIKRSYPFLSVPHMREIFWAMLGPHSAVTFLCTVPICLNQFYPKFIILVPCDTTSVEDCCPVTRQCGGLSFIDQNVKWIGHFDQSPSGVGHAVSWLRHHAASQKVMDLIPDGVIGNFHWHKPSSRTMVLELIQFLTEMSPSNISWG
jgi:hypothetical protein